MPFAKYKFIIMIWSSGSMRSSTGIPPSPPSRPSRCWRGGLLTYVDAPLVRASVHGRTCLLDEADKAPTEVKVLLKTLVADGELLLSDGRLLTDRRSPSAPVTSLESM